MQLRPYQEIGRDFLAGKTRALLADEMRVGKTPQAILAARKIDAQKVLVLCPAIAVGQWCNELRRWGGYDAGSITKGIGKVVVSSYDRALTNKDALCALQWDVLIIDEAHYCKNPTAQRTKLVYGKGGLGYHATHIWTLSGTPAPNHAAELYPMLAAFGAVTGSYSSFVQKYCYTNAMHKPIGTRVAKIPELKQILGTVMLRRTRKEVAPEMPAIGFNFLSVTPDLNQIDTLLKSAHAGEMEAKTQLQKLRGLFEREDPAAALEQHAGDFTIARVYTAFAKVTGIANDIQFSLAAGLYDQTVVFGFYVKPIHLLLSVLRERGISCEIIHGGTPSDKRTRFQEHFQAGRKQVLICQLIAAGTAIDLSKASHGYFLELDWVPGNNMQAANRLVAIGKNVPVTYDIATWDGSPDEAVQRSLARKVSELSKLY